MKTQTNRLMPSSFLRRQESLSRLAQAVKEIPAYAGMMVLLLVALFVLLVSASSHAAEASTSQLMAADVESLISEALIEQGAGDKLSATITGRTNDVLYRGTQPLSISLTALDFDAKSASFKGAVDVYEADTKKETIDLSGRFEVLIEVPVLSQRLHKGDVIEATDIEWISMPEHRLRKDTILSEEALIGFTPRRIISENRPVRAVDIEKPRLMQKGDSVQLSFRTPAMEIRTLGIAMEEGAKGDTIRIRNSDSQVVVQAVITGKGVAEVAPYAQLSLNQ